MDDARAWMFDGEAEAAEPMAEQVEEMFAELAAEDAEEAAEEAREWIAEDATERGGIDAWEDRRTLRGVPREFLAEWLDMMDDASDNVF